MPRYEWTQRRKHERQAWRELPEGARVVIYGRHSPGETQTIASQAEAMRRWVEARGWVLIREFYDEGVEGSRSDRPAFQEMLTYLRTEPRPADGVLTWNTSRFGRDQNDSKFYKADLRRRGYVVLGKEDGIEQSPVAPVLEAMLEWKAEQDLAVISADTKRGLEYLARNGYWPGGFLPKGYVGEKVLLGHRKNGDPRYGTKVRLDPNLRDRVARAWTLRLRGASYRDIHDEVALFRSTKCYSTFFSNALYAGILEYAGKRYPENWSDGARFCEAYVDLDDFEHDREQAHEWAKRHGIGADRHPRNRVSTYLLSGLAVCGCCLEQGELAALAGWTDTRRPSWRSYRCGRKQRLRGSACRLRSMPCWLLEQAVIEKLQEEIFTPQYLHDAVLRANTLLADSGRAGQHKARQAAAAESAARRTLENLGKFIATHGANPVIEEQYRAAERQWRLAEGAHAAAKAALGGGGPERLITFKDAEESAKDLVALLHTGDVLPRRRFLAAFIRRIVVFDDDGIVELTEEPGLDALQAAVGGRGRTGGGGLASIRRVPPAGFEPAISTLKG